MSYLVLARKWRPQTFEDVVGQEHVTRTLQNSLEQDHLAHALLFSGPRGVGKTSIARILAKAMNCEKGPLPVPCNECGICREITDGASVDVLEIDGASNRGIDEIRQLRETIRFQPVRCRYRVFIIDEVHMLTKEAFNALLKTLEEPPAHVFFIFATTEPHRIPATIHSRCQHYEFRRIQVARLADHLDKIVAAEGMNLPREATLLLAREAEGSVRDSLSLLDQVAAYGASSIEDVHEALGVLGTTVMQKLAVAIISGDIDTALEVVSEVYRLGVDFQKFVADLILFFRNVLILKKTGAKGSELVELDSTEAEVLVKSFAQVNSNTLLNILDALMKGQASISSSSTPRLSVELLLMRLCTMREVVSIDSLIDSLKKAAEKGVMARGTGSASGEIREQATAPVYGSGGAISGTAFSESSASEKKIEKKTEAEPSLPDEPPKTPVKPHSIAAEEVPDLPPAPPWQDSSIPEPEPLSVFPEEPGDESKTVSIPSASFSKGGDIKEKLAEATGQPVKTSPDDSGAGSAEQSENSVSSQNVELDMAAWKGFVEFVKTSKPSLGSVLAAARADVDKGSRTVTLYCDNAMHHDMLTDSDYSKSLSEMGFKFFGSAVKISAKPGNTVGKSSSRPDNRDVRQKLIETPLVQEAMKVFGAKISGVQLYQGKKRGSSPA